MKFTDGIKLISHPALQPGKPTQWADLGCGAGFFTNVLSSLLAKASTIYAIDEDAAAVKKVKVAEGVYLNTYTSNFIQSPFPFGVIDGIMLANALHYVRDKNNFTQKLKLHLAPGAVLLLVEYDTTNSNAWVPYPISFSVLKELCLQHGFTSIEKINQMPSAFGRSNMYAALVTL